MLNSADLEFFAVVARSPSLAAAARDLDVTPSAVFGHARDLVAAPRLDNLATAYAGTRAFLEAVGDLSDGAADAHTPVLVLFDHEEIGSTTNRGAFSQFLPALLERIVASRGGDRVDYLRAMADTIVCSADMAHATHPNYPERHEPQHHIAINQTRFRHDGGTLQTVFQFTHVTWPVMA